MYMLYAFTHTYSLTHTYICFTCVLLLLHLLGSFILVLDSFFTRTFLAVCVCVPAWRVAAEGSW